MSLPTCWPEPFRRVYYERVLEGNPRLEGALRRCRPLPVFPVRSRAEIPPKDLSPATLFLAAPRGEPLGRCPGSPGQLCCNYMTADLYVGCTLGCAYCVLRSYLNFSPVTVYLDPGPTIRRALELRDAHPGRVLRIGTGEVGDSLLLDPVFCLSAELIEAFAPFPELVLELKTKTGRVDHLLDLPLKGSTVIGFSMNPEPLIRRYDGNAAGLEERLDAAERALSAGYRVSFHFDPVFRVDGWEEMYTELIRRLGRLPARRIAWISLGTFRYAPELKDRLGRPDFLLEEFVPCRDGKFRYPQRTRGRMYRRLAEELRSRVGAPVYLCMESPAVWANVFGANPREISELGDIFKPLTACAREDNHEPQASRLDFGPVSGAGCRGLRPGADR